MKLRTGQMTVTTDSDGDRRVHLNWDKDKEGGKYETVLTAEESRRFLAKYDRRTNILMLLFLPFSAIFYVLLGIHNGIEWLFEKLSGEGKK